MEESDDPMLGGEEEGDMLLGGGNAVRDEDDFFLRGNAFFLYKNTIYEKNSTGPQLGGRLAGLRSQVEEVRRSLMQG